MTWDQIITFSIIGGGVALFVWNRWRYDIVALFMLFVAVLAGIVPVEKAFTGFSDPVVVTVACILVISAAISNSGFIDMILKIMNRFLKYKNLPVFILVAMVMTLSAFINNVGALAVFLPIALSFAQKSERRSSEFLMPLSFASLLGGLITLIGTPPNLMISAIRREFTGAPYQLFDFAPVGLAICVIGIFYLTFAWRLLPKDRRGQPLPEDLFKIEDYVSEILVPENSSLIGKTIREIESDIEGDFTVIGLVRGTYRSLIPSGRHVVRQDDVLIIKSDPVVLKNIVDTGRVTLAGSKDIEDISIVSEEVGITEAIIMAGSDLIGSTPRSLQLRRRFSLNLLAVRQAGRRIQDRLSTVRFGEGDIIVLQGSLDAMPETLQELGCLPLAERNLQLGRQKFMLLPVVIMLGAIALSVFNILPLAIALLGGVVVIAVLQIMRPSEIYTSIDISVIILLGALIPVTQAMQDTGGARLIAGFVSSLTDGLPVYGIIGIVMMATMLVTPFLNNAATVLLMAPIAANLAQNLHLGIDAFLMAVAVGASSDFLTPIGHQSNTLVMAPGGYKFTDYFRLGFPLTLLVIFIGVPVIMMVWL